MNLKKISNIISSCFLSLLVFSCADFVPEQKAEIKLNAESLVIENAVAGWTSFELMADVTGTSSDLLWTCEDENVVTVNSNKNKATILVTGSGTSKIVCSTKNNSVSASCSVTIILGKVYCHSVKTISVENIEADSVTLNWNCADDVPELKFELYEKDSDVLLDSGFVYSSADSFSFMNLSKETDYTVYAYACVNPETDKEYIDSVKAQVDFKTLNSLNAPDSVSDVKVIPGEHEIKLTWKDPSVRSFTEVLISTENKNIKNESIDTISVLKGVNEVIIENLKANSDYKFILKSKDKYGNIQGDSNNISNVGMEVSVNTLKDTTAPLPVEKVSINVTDSSISITWDDEKASLSNDYSGIELWCNNSRLEILPAGTTVKNLTLEDGTYNFSLWTFDFDGNKSENVFFSFQTGNYVSTGIESYTAEAQWTGQIKVKWNTEELYSKYALFAVNQNDPNDFAYSEIYDSFDEVGVINNLTIGAVYDVYVCSVSETSTNKIFMVDDSVSHSVQVKKIVYEIAQPWGHRRLVPFITENENFINCVIAQNDDEHYKTHTYQKWVIMPGINGGINDFSLLACSADGTESDLYFNIDSSISGSMDTDVDNTNWGHSIDGNGIYTRVGTLDKIKNKGLGSFYFDTSSVNEAVIDGFSEWKSLYCSGNGYLIWSTNSNVIGEPESYIRGLNKNSDTVFAYKETIITE